MFVVSPNLYVCSHVCMYVCLCEYGLMCVYLCIYQAECRPCALYLFDPVIILLCVGLNVCLRVCMYACVLILRVFVCVWGCMCVNPVGCMFVYNCPVYVYQ